MRNCRTGSRSGCRIIGRFASNSTPSPRSRWSRRWASAGGRPISIPSRATSSPAAGRRCNSSASITDLFDGYSRNADFIQAYIFPGGMLIDEPRFEALARERGLSWEDRDGFGLDYAETLRQWRERYDAAVREGRLHGLQRAFPQPLALLPHVLRRRLPGRRHRRCAGDDGPRRVRAIADPTNALGRGLAAIRRQYQVPDTFPPEVLAAAAKPRGGARSERPCRPDRRALRHARSRFVDRPRPGVRDRAERQRPAAPLCDRRRRLVRRRWRADRRRGMAARDDALSARRQGGPLSAGAERRRGEPAARRAAPGGRLHGARRS